MNKNIIKITAILTALALLPLAASGIGSNAANAAVNYDDYDGSNAEAAGVGNYQIYNTMQGDRNKIKDARGNLKEAREDYREDNRGTIRKNKIENNPNITVW